MKTSQTDEAEIIATNLMRLIERRLATMPPDKQMAVWNRIEATLAAYDTKIRASSPSAQAS